MTSLANRLSEYGADDESLLAYLCDLRERAKQGIPTEKSTVKGDVVTVVETFPGLELACTKYIHAIALKIKGQAPAVLPTLDIVVGLAVPTIEE